MSGGSRGGRARRVLPGLSALVRATATVTASATSTASPAGWTTWPTSACDALWLNPVMASPMADHGYDVADPRDVDPLFGGLDALDRLIDAAHARGIRVTMDLVPNHTSSAHPWFGEALAESRQRARDRYIFRDGPASGDPPAEQLGVGVRRPGLDPGRADGNPGSGTCTCSTPRSPT